MDRRDQYIGRRQHRRSQVYSGRGQMGHPDMKRAIRDAALRAFPEARLVLLFGSHARGEARPDSDYDVLVVAETDLSPPSRGAKLRRELRGLRASFDLLVLTPAELERVRGWRSSVAYRAAREGAVLDEAA